MFNQPYQQPGTGLWIRGIVNLCYLALSGYVTCFTPFLRRNFGRGALGINAAIAFVIIMFYRLAHPESHMLGEFQLLWMAFVVMQWFRTAWLTKKGIAIHSRCDGYPWLGYALPFVKQEPLARVIEFLGLLFFGVSLGRIDMPLSAFLVFGSLALLVKGGIDSEIDRKRLQAMRDAEL
ncbi:MAG TPA: hypothetical protein VGJ26_00890, partial [Pirellulales bacterium]